jgi:hypothetical protein
LAETAVVLFWALLASGQMTMRKLAFWELCGTGIDLAT